MAVIKATRLRALRNTGNRSIAEEKPQGALLELLNIIQLLLISGSIPLVCNHCSGKIVSNQSGMPLELFLILETPT